MPIDVKQAALTARRLLSGLGVDHVVGTAWNQAGTPVVTVDLPPGTDGTGLRDKLSEIGAEVVIRHATRRIVMQAGQH